MNIEKCMTFVIQMIGNKNGPISTPITNSASFSYANSKEAIDIFEGISQKDMYSRLGNPTNTKLESVFSQIECGENNGSAIASNSGMGAIALATMALLKANDEVISIGGLFGGTFAYFSCTLKRFGIKTHFIDVDDIQKIKKVCNEQTKLIYMESVGNPNMKLCDIRAIAKIADELGLALVVDNTVTPLSLKPMDLGADIVAHSTTKLSSGNSSSLGGIVVFRDIKDKNDKFLHNRFVFLQEVIQKRGKKALYFNAKSNVLRDLGVCANAFSSYFVLLGLETLPLRVQRIAQNVQKISNALYEKGVSVNHPSLKSHKHNRLFDTLYNRISGPLMSIDLGNTSNALKFLDKLKMLTLSAHIGDSRSLALHMGSTIYKEYSKKDRDFLGISEGLVRLSIGLENPDDIVNDILQALK